MKVPLFPRLQQRLAKGKNIWISDQQEAWKGTKCRLAGVRKSLPPPTKKREGPTEQAFVVQSCASKTNMSFTLKTWGGICRRRHGNQGGLAPSSQIRNQKAYFVVSTLYSHYRQNPTPLQLQCPKRDSRFNQFLKMPFANCRASIKIIVLNADQMKPNEYHNIKNHSQPQNLYKRS